MVLARFISRLRIIVQVFLAIIQSFPHGFLGNFTAVPWVCMHSPIYIFSFYNTLQFLEQGSSRYFVAVTSHRRLSCMSDS
jgi:hypothetical protein